VTGVQTCALPILNDILEKEKVREGEKTILGFLPALEDYKGAISFTPLDMVFGLELWKNFIETNQVNEGEEEEDSSPEESKNLRQVNEEEEDSSPEESKNLRQVNEEEEEEKEKERRRAEEEEKEKERRRAEEEDHHPEESKNLRQVNEGEERPLLAAPRKRRGFSQRKMLVLSEEEEEEKEKERRRAEEEEKEKERRRAEEEDHHPEGSRDLHQGEEEEGSSSIDRPKGPEATFLEKLEKNMCLDPCYKQGNDTPTLILATSSGKLGETIRSLPIDKQNALFPDELRSEDVTEDFLDLLKALFKGKIIDQFHREVPTHNILLAIENSQHPEDDTIFERAVSNLAAYTQAVNVANLIITSEKTIDYKALNYIKSVIPKNITAPLRICLNELKTSTKEMTAALFNASIFGSTDIFHRFINCTLPGLDDEIIAKLSIPTYFLLSSPPDIDIKVIGVGSVCTKKSIENIVNSIRAPSQEELETLKKQNRKLSIMCDLPENEATALIEEATKKGVTLSIPRYPQQNINE
jgi:chemotaxis protein histidine kinase CheA